jgi:hypothetical protein
VLLLNQKPFCSILLRVLSEDENIRVRGYRVAGKRSDGKSMKQPAGRNKSTNSFADLISYTKLGRGSSRL